MIYRKYTQNCTLYKLNYSFTTINLKRFKETTISIVMPFSHLRLITSICEPLCFRTCVCPHMCLIHMLNINWKYKFTFKTWATKLITKRNDERSNGITYIISCTRTGLTDGYRTWTYIGCLIFADIRKAINTYVL